MNAAGPSILLRGGYLHTPADPHASAILLRDGVVAWTGDDDAARYLTEPVDVEIDVQGALIAPAFVDAFSGREPGLGAAEGVVAAGLASQQDGCLDFASLGGESRRFAQVLGLGTASLTDDVAAIASALEQGLSPALLTAQAEDAYTAAVLEQAESTVGRSALMQARIQVHGTLPPDDAVLDRLSELGGTLVLGPQSRDDVDYPALLRRGLLIALASHDLGAADTATEAASSEPDSGRSLWHRIAALSVRGASPHTRLTVRAAFNAATRGGWRAAGHDGVGLLAAGSPAHVAVYDVEGAFLVQTPDDRLAAWSTDPRAGVPQLPDLSEGNPLPHCVLTLSAGEVSFDAHGWLT